MKNLMWIGAGLVMLAGGVLGGRFVADHIAQTGGPFAGLVSVGQWSRAPAAGREEASAELLAYMARTGILALSEREAVYFFADQDSTGLPLRGGCLYEARIPRMRARWWSLAAYDDAYILMANAAERYSVTATDHSGDGGTVMIARVAQDGLWLPVGKAAHFTLTFRVYQPEEGFDRTSQDNLPVVRLAEPCDEE